VSCVAGYGAHPTTDAIAAGVARLNEAISTALAIAAAARSTRPRACRAFANGGSAGDYKCRRHPKARPSAHPHPDHRGTGSITRYRHPDTETDERCWSRARLLPAAAIVDFELTLTMPLRLTADTASTA